MGCSPSATGCSSVGPPWGHKSCQQTCSSVVFSPSPWVHRSCQEPAPVLTPHGITASFRHISVPAWSLPETVSGYLLHCGLHGLQGDSLLHHGLHHGLQGKNLCSGPGAPPPSLSSLTFVSEELFLSHGLTPLSQRLFHRRFFPFLKYIITDALSSLMGSALAISGSILELVGIGSIRHGGSFSQLLTEAIPIAPR